MSTLTISLPDEMTEWAQSQAQTKGFSDAGEYALELLREAKVRDDEFRLKEAELEALLLEAVNAGEGESVDAAWWTNFRSELDEKLERQRRNGTACP